MIFFSFHLSFRGRLDCCTGLNLELFSFQFNKAWCYSGDCIRYFLWTIHLHGEYLVFISGHGGATAPTSQRLDVTRFVFYGVCQYLVKLIASVYFAQCTEEPKFTLCLYYDYVL